MHLGAGEFRIVTLPIAPHAFQYRSTAAGQWETAAGHRKMKVGTTSLRDLRLKSELNVK
jgi:hypothetical protein